MGFWIYSLYSLNTKLYDDEYGEPVESRFSLSRRNTKFNFILAP